MRLFEHRDFEQAVIQASEHFGARGLRPALVEKDYYVTEALRIIAGTYGDKVIFKGGTSLAKGWNLIRRFSEDVDIFLDPRAFDPVLGKRGIDRELKALRDAVDEHPALTFVKEESQTIGGFGRSDRFAFRQRFGGPGEVGAMLRSDEYAAMKADYDAVSREHFANSYFAPADMSFATSDALFPSGELADVLGAEYEAQCRQLCLGPYPPWGEARARFETLKTLL